MRKDQKEENKNSFMTRVVNFVGFHSKWSLAYILCLFGSCLGWDSNPCDYLRLYEGKGTRFFVTFSVLQESLTLGNASGIARECPWKIKRNILKNLEKWRRNLGKLWENQGKSWEIRWNLEKSWEILENQRINLNNSWKIRGNLGKSEN